jgi:hypothetical protein
MKYRLLAFLAIAALPLMGFDCINDPFFASINVNPISISYDLSGSNRNFDKTSPQITTSDFYNEGYSLSDVSVYDLQISTSGAPSLGASNCTIWLGTNSAGPWTQVVTCTGDWSVFNTPQSIFSPYFSQPNATALKSLINAAFAGNRLYVRVSGNAGTGGAIPAGYAAKLTLFIRATGSLSN